MKIILGSQSPRRREIMSYFSLPFVQVASDFDEESIPYQGNPAKHAMLLSQKKAETLAVRFPQEVILTADSVVSCNGKLYNKPRDEHEAAEFLRTFSETWQEVTTGVTVRRGPEVHTSFEETRLIFHKLTDDQIKKFHNHIYFLDKAGGYAIEKSANLIVSRIEGCYYNVVGLPINTVQRLLLKLGIDLWDYLSPIP
ncbi:MAG TPA: Maf family nucleotide pyrophosphatase [Rhabdochlamydiaceae bacterium]|jgi:septum formation protein|nr:Maf family nucleotide pyrophosphatase [Rhabdochlamydiaceae bacterium]